MAAKIKIIDLVYKTTKPLSQIIADAVNEMSVVTKDDGHQVYVRVTDVDQNRVILINDVGDVVNIISNDIVQDKRIDRLIESLDV